MKPEEIIARLERDIRFKKPYGFMVGIEKEFYEAELECMNLARRNIANPPIREQCACCCKEVSHEDIFCKHCGQRLQDSREG